MKFFGIGFKIFEFFNKFKDNKKQVVKKSFYSKENYFWKICESE